MAAGRIIKGIGGFYTVQTPDGQSVECKACGRFRNEGLKPLVGDAVIISGEGQSETASIRDILERKNVLVRPAVANVDQLLIVVSPKAPAPDLLLIDKLLLQAHSENIEPLLCVNKVDKYPERARELAKIYEKAVPTYVISAKDGTGTAELTDAMRGATVCFAGQSAAGKSTLINRLGGVTQTTGRLSQKTSRGRHTTRSAELFPCAATGGFIIDTPGFSVLVPTRIAPAELGAFWPEIRAHSANCRFSSCLHRNEPDCAVKLAVDEGMIDRGRYERYLELLKQEENASW